MKTIFTFFCLTLVSAIMAQTSFKTGISTTSNGNELIKVVQLSDGSYVGIGVNDL